MPKNIRVWLSRRDHSNKAQHTAYTFTCLFTADSLPLLRYWLFRLPTRESYHNLEPVVKIMLVSFTQGKPQMITWFPEVSCTASQIKRKTLFAWHLTTFFPQDGRSSFGEYWKIALENALISGNGLTWGGMYGIYPIYVWEWNMYFASVSLFERKIVVLKKEGRRSLRRIVDTGW